ncbi:acyltransferase domain-containing protein, partial [Salinactinospora qingdaonensis]|uniref:acyltransferase domain-containing protein n=1 Tax=Salinactinospora qingdaonensis TaxID=702744 RepID=UPI0031E942ED
PPAHSPLLDEYLSGLAAALTGLRPQEGNVAMVSTVTTTPTTGTHLDAAYWSLQLRAPVKLQAAIHRLAGENDRVFVELSPQAVLAPAIEDTLAHHQLPGTVITPGTSATGDEHTRLLAGLAGLYTHGHPPTWPTNPHHRPAELPLPHWRHTTETTQTPLASTLASTDTEQRRALLAETLRTIVADLTGQTITPAEHEHDLTSLDLASRDLLVLRTHLRSLHPALAHLEAATIYHAATLTDLTETLLELLPTSAASEPTTASSGHDTPPSG